MLDNLNNKNKIAELYYTFTCDNKDKHPILVQHIIPEYKYDINPVIYIILYIIIIIYIIIVCAIIIKSR